MSMARKSNRRQETREEHRIEGPRDDEQPQPQGNGQRRSVAAHVRERQRAIADREAARLARPEQRPGLTLAHADRKKSAVTSTPSGVLPKKKLVADGKRNNTSQAQQQDEWCGPFHVARQMIAQREEARRQREEELDHENSNSGNHPLDQVMEEYETEKKRKAHPSLLWKAHASDTKTSTSANDSLYVKRQRRASLQTQERSIRSLFELCLSFLVDNFDQVESLGGDFIESSIRKAIAHSLIAQDKMNGSTLSVLAEPGIEALELADCSGITQDQLSQTLVLILPAGLRYLALDQAGRCWGSKTVQTVISVANKCSLFALSIGGAYLLKDEDAAQLVVAMSRTLSSLEFKACPSLGAKTMESISSSFSAHQGQLLELCLEHILNLKATDFEKLAARPLALKSLKSLSLRYLGTELDDGMVGKLLAIAGDSLESLDLTGNYALTDSTLDHVRRCSRNLRALHLGEVKNWTASGLEALFTFVPNMDPPPMLRTLSLANCDHEAVTDQVVELVCQAATKQPTAAPTQHASSSSMHFFGGLVLLDIQGSTMVTDTCMEVLAATCVNTLQELNVSFCPLITDRGLGYLVDQCGPQFATLRIWGNAQVTDEFLDGHIRSDDPNLHIIGAWMKKSTTRTMR